MPESRYHSISQPVTYLTGFRSPRHPPCGRVCGNDTAAPHGGTLPPFLGSATRAVLKIVFLFVACWNADGVGGRNLELDHFLGMHCVDIYLQTETRLR
jgi:hypothetical protein